MVKCSIPVVPGVVRSTGPVGRENKHHKKNESQIIGYKREINRSTAWYPLDHDLGDVI